MKKILSVLVLCLLCILSGCAPRAPRSLPQIPIQQKAAHLILYKGRNANQDIGACTVTAVGPHAIMTADHCDIGTGTDDFSLDLATSERHVQKRWKDDHDHIIYGVDGPAFKDYVVIHQRPAKVGEFVYYYGDPEGDFPQTLFRGRVSSPQDVSEVDRDAGIEYYTLESYPGCSGSAVYGADGAIVGLITYGVVEPELGGLEQHRSSIGFALNFSQKDLDEVAKFQPSKHFKAKKSPLPSMFPF